MGTVIHDSEHRLTGGPVKGPRPRAGALLLSLTASVTVLGAVACDSDPADLPDPRFGQVGELQVEILSRVPGDEGILEEAFVWRSEGPWVLVERMSYLGRAGGQTVRRPTLNPGELAPEYASLVQQLNETPGLRLFGPDVPQELDPICLPARSRIVLTLRDHFRDQVARWIRCVDGTFFTATSASAGPDAGAARVVTAAQLARFFTVGEGSISTYLGSRPFHTLDRGEDSPARPQGPQVFRSTDGEAPPEWEAFWAQHAGSGAPAAQVDWERDMVLLAAVGLRHEAGEGVRIQRILPIDQGTRIEVVQRVPGDFCSPAAKEIHPFDLVVTRRTGDDVLFNEPVVERIPCGL